MARAVAVALILLAPASVAAAEPAQGGAGPRRGAEGAAPPAAGRGVAAGERRLDEVRITGTAESPDVLFFLPRARFRLNPPRPERDWRERILADSPELEKEPR